MTKFLTAITLTIALPAVAHAQAAPAPKTDCCEKMKAEGKPCCCKDKAGDDTKKGAEAPQAGQHHDHS